jgi:hypothetical protein
VTGTGGKGSARRRLNKGEGNMGTAWPARVCGKRRRGVRVARRMGLDASVASGEGGGPAGGMMQSPMAHDRGLPWGEGTGGLAWGGPAWRRERRGEGAANGRRMRSGAPAAGNGRARRRRTSVWETGREMGRIGVPTSGPRATVPGGVVNLIQIQNLNGFKLNLNLFKF